MSGETCVTWHPFLLWPRHLIFTWWRDADLVQCPHMFATRRAVIDVGTQLGQVACGRCVRPRDSSHLRGKQTNPAGAGVLRNAPAPARSHREHCARRGGICCAGAGTLARSSASSPPAPHVTPATRKTFSRPSNARPGIAPKSSPPANRRRIGPFRRDHRSGAGATATVLLDVGGGSTEFIPGMGPRNIFATAFDLARCVCWKRFPTVIRRRMRVLRPGGGISSKIKNPAPIWAGSG